MDAAGCREGLKGHRLRQRNPGLMEDGARMSSSEEVQRVCEEGPFLPS